MAFQACMDALLDEMEDFVCEHYGHDSAVWRSGDFAAGALLEFKGRHDGARLGHWTVGDVGEFLLNWFPRTVWADEDLQRDVPDCAAVFFRFMAARGSLTGDPLSELELACAQLHSQFLRSCRDPLQWGPAKQRLSLILAPAHADPSRPASTADPRHRSSRTWRVPRPDAPS
jgi:hypothetical protein